MRPETDERVDVVIDGIGRNVQDVVQKHVRVDGAHEEARGRSRVVDGDDAGPGGAAEVVLHDFDAAPRRALFVARKHARVHEDGEVLAQDALRKRDELLGNVAKHDPRIRTGIDRRELHDEPRRLHRQMHRLGEQLLLRRDVTEDGRRSDLQLARDVGERRRLIAFRGEDVARDGEELIAVDGRRTAHL